jgi:methylthioribose-1-phosphate isomerase
MELMIIETIDFRKGKVVLLDQTILPLEERLLEIESVDRLCDSIRSMEIRGAPAIGIAAAYGVLLELENVLRGSMPDPPSYLFDHGADTASIVEFGVDAETITARLLGAAESLSQTRPTAVNLFWALDRMRKAIERCSDDPARLFSEIPAEAFAIHEEQLDIERRIGRHGEKLLSDGMSVLTHCNAGGLATAGFGTALGVIYAAKANGKRIKVYADETRPLLQGARLTAWELGRAGIDVTVLCDGAAASLLSSGRVDAVLVGADRIAASGDAANKIGTLGLAVLCERFGIPFYIAAPWSSFDLSAPSGDDIVVEFRNTQEVTSFQGRRTAPDGIDAYNPAFDVTPAGLITAIITEDGIIRDPSEEGIRGAYGGGSARSNET